MFISDLLKFYQSNSGFRSLFLAFLDIHSLVVSFMSWWRNFSFTIDIQSLLFPEHLAGNSNFSVFWVVHLCFTTSCQTYFQTSGGIDFETNKDWLSTWRQIMWRWLENILKIFNYWVLTRVIVDIMLLLELAEGFSRSRGFFGPSGKKGLFIKFL